MLPMLAYIWQRFVLITTKTKGYNMKKFIHAFRVVLTLILLSTVTSAFAKQYDLVLVQGLANKPKWRG